MAMHQGNLVGNQLPADYNVLMQAIITCSGPSVQNLLLLNPSLIHIKAWHGMTALHRACLGGDYNIVHLFLRAGADPNIRNDNGETPTLFACKRGNPAILHLILDYKGDVNVVDRQGRGAMHHAAESGSVTMLHYLLSVYNMDLHVADAKLQTPFHIVCGYGHMDALKYLIKKDRCDLMKVNREGDTPLHILAEGGHSHLCWLLLCEVGCQALHINNNAGYNPKDLAEQRDRQGHREIAPVLDYYYKKSLSNRHTPVTGPVLLWYWMLLMPAIVYGGVVILSHVITPYLHAVVIILGLAYIIYDHSQHVHRMQHVCRWPNPMYAGLFGAGIFHTFAAYFTQIFPNLIETRMLLILTPLLSFLLLYLYWKVWTRDPGVIKRSDFDIQLKRELTLVDLCEPPRKVDDFCTDCEIVKPQWTKHCKLCQECYQDMDHHCLFLLRCVAGKNQLLFVWFISVCLSCMLLFICLGVFHLHQTYKSLSIIEAVGNVFLYSFWLFSLIVMNVMSLLWGVNLLKVQLTAISEGYTNYFRPPGHQSSLTTKEKTLNALYFMMGRSPYAKDFAQNKSLNV